MGVLGKIVSGFCGVLLVGALSGCVSDVPDKTDTPDKVGSDSISGMIVPHHLLVQDHIAAFYETVAANTDSIETIILLSPNHFGYGYSNLQTTDDWQTQSDAPQLATATIQTLAEASSLSIEPEKFELEHGITTQFTFLTQNFPNAKLIPITVKEGTGEPELNALIEDILDLDLQNLLVIASIDFTHYAPEEIAAANDERTVEWLENLPSPIEFSDLTSLAESLDAAINPDSVAMDSPESMYVLLKLANNEGATQFTLWDRTSSAATFGAEDAAENTSHILGYFW